jgi:hypothetical protein
MGSTISVVTIHGSMGREERKKNESLFTQDKDSEVLIATDAAGEGIKRRNARRWVERSSTSSANCFSVTNPCGISSWRPFGTETVRKCVRG